MKRLMRIRYCVGVLILTILTSNELLWAANVGPSGYSTDFSSMPNPADWTTYSYAGSSTDQYELTNVLQTISIADINSPLLDGGTDEPPNINSFALWSNQGGYICTRPTGNRFTVLAVKLFNISGTNATSVQIQYDFDIKASIQESDYPGHRAFYSLTGQAESWIPIPEFSSPTPTSGHLVANLNLPQIWYQSNYLYIVWVDDNASSIFPDPAYVIDNFNARVTAGIPVTPPATVNIISPTNNAFYIAPKSISIEASAISRDGVITQVVFYLDNTMAGKTAESPYTIQIQNPSVGFHTIYAEAFDNSGASAVSPVVNFTVFDSSRAPVVKIINPIDGDSFTGPTNIIISVIAESPAGISNVLFYANDSLIGQVDSKPYNLRWNAIFGNILLYAVAYGADGISTTSSVVNINISEPPINTNPPVIISQEPPAGSSISELTQIRIVFSEPVTNVDARDLLINGKPAKSVSGSGAEYIFTFEQPPYGAVTISWALNHNITDIGYPTNLPFDASNASWTYQLIDRTAPVIVRRIPAAGEMLFFQFNELTVEFSEPVAGVDASDLLVNGIPATNVVSTDNKVYSFTFDNPTNCSLISISFAENHGIVDLAEVPNPFDSNGIGAKWAYRFIDRIKSGNDYFTNRIELTNIPISVVGENLSATTEPGEPLGSGFFQRGASVWWKWVAPFSGMARIDTFLSDFNTTLGVFTGTNVYALTQVAFNDNAPGQQQSLVTFNAVKGTEYQIQVCGAPVGFPPTIQRGIIFLNLSMPPSISITSPRNNSTIIVGEETQFSANVTTNVAPIMQVDFYIGYEYIGTALKPPYSITVTNFPTGSNTVYAVATDIYSQVATSSVNVLSLKPGVTIVSPRDGDYYSESSSITISALTYLQTGSITNVEFYIDGTLIGAVSASPYTITWTNATFGSHKLIAVGYDDSGKTYASSPVYIGVSRLIIKSGDIWKYLDDGSDQGAAWREPDFDDSRWASGPSPLGYGDANGQYPATTNSFGPDPYNKFVTTYYRKEFYITDTNQFLYLTLNFQRDDGIIIYLNGSELYRQNMPSGNVTYTNYAISPVGGSDESSWYGISVSPSLLREGRNVIAVEVHQSDPGSSDLWFNLQFIGTPPIIRNQSPQVSLISPTNNQEFVSPSEIILNCEASDEDGTVVKVEFYDGATLLGEVIDPPYTFKWANPSVGWHNIKVAAIDDLGAKQYSDIASIIIYETTNTPLVEIVSPKNGRVYDNLEGFTNVIIQVRASAFNGVSNVVILADNSILSSLQQEPYSLVWSNVPFGSHTLTAVVYDNLGNSASSLQVSITVVEPPINTEAPKIASVIPAPGSTITNLTTIQITFTERVMGIDAGDLLVNGVPAISMVGSGSNYLFTIAQPDYGLVTISWAENHEITDKGYPENLPFNATAPDATWTYNLIDKIAPYIVSRTPAPGASVSNLTQITIVFNEKVSGVDASDLLINNIPASRVYTADDSAFVFSFPRPLYGIVNVSWATNHGITDRAVEPNNFVPSGNAANWQYLLVAPRITLVPTNAYYRLHKGLWEPSTPVNQWRLLTFDDSLWMSNQAPFYFDIDKTPVPFTGNTLLDDMYGRYQVIYLRHKFYVPNPQSLTNLTIRARCDDGFIAWINGVEVYRSSTVPTGDIPFNYVSNTIANVTETSSGVAYITNVISVPASVLTNGENVLAIQAMNNNTNSSDFLIELELYASAVDPLLIAPMIASVYPAPGDVWALTNIIIKFTEPVSGVSADDLLINGVQASEVTQIDSATYSFSFPQPEYGPVTVSWSATNNIADLDEPPKSFNGLASGAIFNYRLFNPALPHVIRIYPNPGFVTNYLTQITVEFDCEITNITAGDLLINGIPATSISGEYSSFTFTFPQPPYGKVLVNWSANSAIMNRSNTALVLNPQSPGNSWEYLLLDRIAPTIVTQIPPAGAYVSAINYIVVTFSEPVKGVSVGDLLVNGIPSTSLISQGNSYRFGFPTVNATNIVVTWAPDHGITDLALIPNPFDETASNATWSYATEDRVPPAVTKINPAPNATIKSLSSIKVWFSEPVKNIDASDLTINGIPATSMTGSGNGPYEFNFNLNTTGQVVVAWADNHNIIDNSANANQFRGGSWTYTINPDLISYVIHISVDGLGALYLRDYIKNAPEQFPNFVRLQRIGAWTLNARCDYFISVTLPNHSSMFTSLPSLQPAGWDDMSYHGLTIDMDNGSTIHSPATGNPNLPYKYSVFDVVHDNGLSTAFLYSKASLTLLARSWNGTYGASDLVGEDNGKNKIDFVLSTAGNAATGSSLPLVEELERRAGSNTLWNYTFMHFTEPDTIGHSFGWGSATWSNTIRTIDGYIGRVIDAIFTSPTYSNQTIIIITADHGGTGTGHSDATLQINYTIPMFIAGGKIPAGVDLYSLFANRADPGTNRVPYTANYQPLRDGDVGNLVCAFLGLPYISNSRLIPVFGTPPVWLNITKTQTGIMVSWPLNTADFQLQHKPDLSTPGDWISIFEGIQTNESVKYYHFINDKNGRSGFFRLIKPD